MKTANFESDDEVEVGWTNNQIFLLRYLGHLTGNVTERDLKAATESYQRFCPYLKVDGWFGPKTAASVGERFCACPDILPAGRQGKWTIKQLYLWHDIDNVSQEEYIERAATWSRHIGIDFAQWTDNKTANVFAHGRRIDGKGKVIAWSYLPPVGANASTQLEQRYDPVDLGLFEMSCPHEIGHALGLGHIQSEAALMNPYLTRHTEPQAADIQAIQKLYGARDPKPGPDPEPDPPPHPGGKMLDRQFIADVGDKELYREYWLR